MGLPISKLRACPFLLRLLLFLAIPLLAWLPLLGLGSWLLPERREYLWLLLYALLLAWLGLWGSGFAAMRSRPDRCGSFAGFLVRIKGSLLRLGSLFL